MSNFEDNKQKAMSQGIEDGIEINLGEVEDGSNPMRSQDPKERFTLKEILENEEEVRRKLARIRGELGLGEMAQEINPEESVDNVAQTTLKYSPAEQFPEGLSSTGKNLHELLSEEILPAELGDLSKLDIRKEHEEGMKKIKDLEESLNQQLLERMVEELKRWPEVWVVETITEFRFGEHHNRTYEQRLGYDALKQLVGVYASKEEAKEAAKTNYHLMREAGGDSGGDDEKIWPNCDGAMARVKETEGEYNLLPCWSDDAKSYSKEDKDFVRVLGSEKASLSLPYYIGARRINIEEDSAIKGLKYLILNPDGVPMRFDDGSGGRGSWRKGEPLWY